MKKHLLEAAERGNAEAQFNLAIMCENDLDDSRYGTDGSRPDAMRWLLAAANGGLPRAQVKLAEIYAGESDETPESAVRAYGWYLLATAGLTGARRQTAQTARQRIADRLSPAQTAEAESFAEHWTATDAGNIAASPAGANDRRARVIMRARS